LCCDGIARKARVDLEEKTGRSVVTGESFLPPGRKRISDE
jgi:DNA-damage-inducible protein D